MSILATTLTNAIGSATNQLVVGSATGITAPGLNNSLRKNIWIDRECMEVITVDSTTIGVVRGVNGTKAVAHSAGQKIWAGTEADMQIFSEAMTAPGFIYSQFSAGFATAAPSTAIDTATLTTAQMLSVLITGTPTAAANYTTPTAALILAALAAFGAPYLGLSFELSIKNTSAGANTITVVAGVGVTVVGTATIAQNAIKRFRAVVTSVDASTIDLISLGSSTF